MSMEAGTPAIPTLRVLSPTDAIGRGFALVQSRLGPSLGVGLFALGFQFVGVIPWIGWLIALLATPAATGGCYRYGLEAVRGQNPEFEVVLSGFQRWWPVTATIGLAAAIPMLAAAPLLGIAGAMGFLQAISTITSETRSQSLTLIPAMVAFGVVCLPLAMWLSYRLIFAPFIQMDENPPGPIDCIKRSWALTRGSWWRIFGLALLIGLVAIAGLCLCGVGLIAAIPVIYFALAHAYEQLRAREFANTIPHA